MVIPFELLKLAYSLVDFYKALSQICSFGKLTLYSLSSHSPITINLQSLSPQNPPFFHFVCVLWSLY